jgi:hypothetical protein
MTSEFSHRLIHTEKTQNEVETKRQPVQNGNHPDMLKSCFFLCIFVLFVAILFAV